MKKVFIVHGFGSSPNGGWRPWLMAELENQDIYACALSMPNTDKPICSEWVEEISRYIERNKDDEIYLVGHSLGVPAILRFIESRNDISNVKGMVLVSGPSKMNDARKAPSFLDKSFDFSGIRSKVSRVVVIHGDNDPLVPLEDAHEISNGLGAELIIIPNGVHLNGSAGWKQLTPCLDALNKMMK
ncbi:MAG: YqiA/YcfP family alpha/beta fold hydrolase [Minisyncoccia bacterium]